MKKLKEGLRRFAQTLTPETRQRFAQLALGQSPDALMIACSDSRVVPNLFASTDPGDLFVVRNVGNIVPVETQKHSGSEHAALEFSLNELQVQDIIVCGHSECGAMKAICDRANLKDLPHLEDWLGSAKNRLDRFDLEMEFPESLSEVNRLSQRNVLLQVQSLHQNERVKERVQKNKLELHAWWFCIEEAAVYSYHIEKRSFVPIISAADLAGVPAHFE